MSFDSEKTTDQFMDCLKIAIKSAKEHKNIHLHPFHFTFGLFSNPQHFGSEILSRFAAQSTGGDVFLPKAFLDQVQSEINKLPSQNPPPSSPSPSSSLHDILDFCEHQRIQDNSQYIDTGHAIIALYKDAKVAELFKKYGLSEVIMNKMVKDLKRNKPTMNRKAESAFDSLNKYGRDLTKLASDGKLDKVIGRSIECNRLLQVLQRRRKNNAIVTGPPGSGKTAVVELLAQRIVSGDVPDTFLNVRIYELSLTELISGASHRGDFEERLKSVVEEVTEANGQIILFIDEIHQLLGTGATGNSGMDAGNILKPALARGDLKLVGATTDAEYKKYIEKDPALERRFAQIKVEAPNVEETISILRGIKSCYESFHGVKILDSAIVAAANLSDRYITNRHLPDKAIDLIDEACSMVRVQLDSQPAVIDDLERRLLELKVEQEALRQELIKPAHKMAETATADTNLIVNKNGVFDEDNYAYEQTQQRLTHVIDLINQTTDELLPLQQQHAQQRGKVDELQASKRKLDLINTKLDQAQRNKDLQLSADLKYNVLPELKEKIKKLEKEVQEEKQQSLRNAISSGGKKSSSVPLVSEIVTVDQIASIISRSTGIPLTKLSQSERSRILTLEDELSFAVIGQHTACKAVSEAIIRSRAGFNSRNQPLGSFLFCGSTGVGKTELAKALTRSLFDNPKSLLRFDMSEYGEAHAVSRLIGAAPGYIGYEEGGQLTEAVRKNPYQVLLFDEVEKAHKSIWNIFLQVLDDGRLTDNQGRTVDFTNTIIIFTTNLGSQHLLDSINCETGEFNKPLAQIKAQVLIDVKKYFRPEMLNRFSELIVFTPLTKADIEKIIQLQLLDLSKRLKEQNISIIITPDTISDVIMRYYDAKNGARPIKRFLEKEIVTSLSRHLISGDLKPNAVVRVSTNGEVLALLHKRDTETKNKRSGVSFSSTEENKLLSTVLQYDIFKSQDTLSADDLALLTHQSTFRLPSTGSQTTTPTIVSDVDSDSDDIEIITMSDE